MFPVDLSVGFFSKLFGAWLVLNLLLSLVSGDYRLRLVALLFIAIWLATIFPQMELLASPVCFLALTRIQIRRPNETTLSWWLVPVIAAELVIFASQLIYIFGDYMAHWILMQGAFAAQLTAITIQSARSIAKRASSYPKRSTGQTFFSEPDRQRRFNIFGRTQRVNNSPKEVEIVCHTMR
jgi:hypothetical protein